MQVDPSALDDIKARLDDLDDAVRGITSMLSVLVLMGTSEFDGGYFLKARVEAERNLDHPAAFDSTRT